METQIKVTGRNPVPRVINVKQGSADADKIIFILDTDFGNTARCAVIGDKYRQAAEFNEGIVIWNIAGEFTQNKGSFDIQLEITQGERVWKSDVMVLLVSESAEGSKPVGNAEGDVVGSILTKCSGITDEGIIGYIKPEIQQRNVSVCRGGLQQFTIQDYIKNTVVWSVSGNTDSSTDIDENGLLTVGENETSVTLTVMVSTPNGDSDSVTVKVDLSIAILSLFNNGERDICPASGMVVTLRQSNGTDYEITDRIYRKRTPVINASTDIKIPFTHNLTGYSKFYFTGGFLTTYGGGYDVLSVGLYDKDNSVTELKIYSGYGSYTLDIDPAKEYSALRITSCYGEIEIKKIWLMPYIEQEG